MVLSARVVTTHHRPLLHPLAFGAVAVSVGDTSKFLSHPLFVPRPISARSISFFSVCGFMSIVFCSKGDWVRPDRGQCYRRWFGSLARGISLKPCAA